MALSVFADFLGGVLNRRCRWLAGVHCGARGGCEYHVD